jgi:hypothetical protein
MSFVRKFLPQFGSAAGTGDGGIGVFGSAAADAPAHSTDPSVVASLANWAGGWLSAVLAGNSPTVDDLNAPDYVFGYQLCYLLQEGLAEWDTDTEYLTGSLVQNGSGIVYVSLQDANTGNALPTGTAANAWWKRADGRSTRTVTAADSAAVTDDRIRLDSTEGTFAETLPALDISVGQRLIINWVAGAVAPTIVPDGADTILTPPVFVTLGDSFTFFNPLGTQWELE